MVATSRLQLRFTAGSLSHAVFTGRQTPKAVISSVSSFDFGQAGDSNSRVPNWASQIFI